MDLIDKFNKLSKTEFISTFGNIFEKTEWIAERCYESKPYNNLDQLVLKMMEILNLDFKKIVTRDVGFWKPVARQVIAGANLIEIPTPQCLFIGDGQYDMYVATKAGMIAIHLSKSKILECDYQIENLIDAIPIISSFLNRF